MYYILDDNDNPVSVDNVFAWVKWHGEHGHEDRVHMVSNLGLARISTRFFGTAFDDLICFWETMVFLDNKPVQGLSGRIDTWEKAQKLHKDVEDLYKTMVRFR